MRQRPSWASLERWLPMTITLRRSFVPMPAVLALLGLLIVLAILASLSLVPLFAGALAPTGGVSPSGLIAFDRDGDIYVVEPEPGAMPRAIVSGPDEDSGPVWSFDGQRLVFFRVTSRGETPMLTDADGSDPIPLADEPIAGIRWVDWTPDSSGLVLSIPGAVDAVQPSGLVMLSADGSGDLSSIGQDLTQAPVNPARSRPGSSATIDLLYRLAADPAELRWIGPSGSGPLLRVDDMAGVRTAGHGGEFDFIHPDWSPRGDRFAYATLNDVVGVPTGNGLRVHVAGFEPDEVPAGRGDTIVEFDPLSEDEGWPLWSPDGSRVAFQAYANRQARLVIMPVPTDGPIDPTSAVVSPAMTASQPMSLGYTWAADGETVLLVDGEGEGHPAYFVDASTGALTPFEPGVSLWPTTQPSAG